MGLEKPIWRGLDIERGVLFRGHFGPKRPFFGVFYGSIDRAHWTNLMLPV